MADRSLPLPETNRQLGFCPPRRREPRCRRSWFLRLGSRALAHECIEHAVQVGRRQLDVGVLVLTGTPLRGEHPAAMDLFEVPIWELVSALGVPVVFVIYTELPATVFRRTVVVEVLVLLRRRWPVTTPVISFVEDKASQFDQPPRMAVRSRTQSHRHQAPPAKHGRRMLLSGNTVSVRVLRRHPGNQWSLGAGRDGGVATTG